MRGKSGSTAINVGKYLVKFIKKMRIFQRNYTTGMSDPFSAIICTDYMEMI
jgi:hypothetical protein